MKKCICGKDFMNEHDVNAKYDNVFEDDFDSVEYLSADDLFETENDALKGLIKILNERLKK